MCRKHGGLPSAARRRALRFGFIPLKKGSPIRTLGQQKNVIVPNFLFSRYSTRSEVSFEECDSIPSFLLWIPDRLK
jgi:hypothetical protein